MPGLKAMDCYQAQNWLNGSGSSGLDLESSGSRKRALPASNRIVAWNWIIKLSSKTESRKETRKISLERNWEDLA